MPELKVAETLNLLRCATLPSIRFWRKGRGKPGLAEKGWSRIGPASRGNSILKRLILGLRGVGYCFVG